MGLLSGNALQKVFGKVFRAVYEDGQLLEIRKVRQPNGTLRDEVVAEHAVKVQFDVVTSEMSKQEGYATTDQRCIVLRDRLTVEEITTDFRLIGRGKRWTLNSVTTDPARSYFDSRASLAKT